MDFFLKQILAGQMTDEYKTATLPSKMNVKHKSYLFVRFEALTAVLVRIQVFRDGMPCRWMSWLLT